MVFTFRDDLAVLPIGEISAYRESAFSLAVHVLHFREQAVPPARLARGPNTAPVGPSGIRVTWLRANNLANSTQLRPEHVDTRFRAVAVLSTVGPRSQLVCGGVPRCLGESSDCFYLIRTRL